MLSNSLRVLNTDEIEKVAGGFASNPGSGGPTPNLTTDPKKPPSGDIPTISFDSGADSISITDTFSLGGDATATGSFTFDLPSGGFDHATIGFNDNGTTGSFTYAMDQNTLSETISHTFDNGLIGSATFSSGDTETQASVSVSFHF